MAKHKNITEGMIDNFLDKAVLEAESKNVNINFIGDLSVFRKKIVDFIEMGDGHVKFEIFYRFIYF